MFGVATATQAHTVGGRIKGIITTLTNRISQSKVVALRCKYGEEPSLVVAAVRTGHDQREHTHYGEHGHLCDQDAPQKGPDDVPKVQQHHVLEEQRRQRELGHKVAQTFGLGGGDDVGPARDVAAQDDAEALEQSREQLVDGHGAGDGGGVQLPGGRVTGHPAVSDGYRS